MQSLDPSQDEALSYAKARKVLRETWDATDEEIALWVYHDRLAIYSPELWKGKYWQESSAWLTVQDENAGAARLLAHFLFSRREIESFDTAGAGRYLNYQLVLGRLARCSDLDYAKGVLDREIRANRLTPLHYVTGAVPWENDKRGNGRFPEREQALFAAEAIEELARREFGASHHDSCNVGDIGEDLVAAAEEHWGPSEAKTGDKRESPPSGPEATGHELQGNELSRTELAAQLFRRHRSGSWEFRFNGRSCPPAPEYKGFRYLQHLLQSPGRQVSAVELTAIAESSGDSGERPRNANEWLDEQLNISGLGDAGAALDKTARQQYEKALARLRDQREDAREINDVERVAEIEQEMEFYAKELKRGTGRGGREVRAASTQKRARQAVSIAIKRAIKFLEKHCPDLGNHLRDAVTTGSQPLYRPQSKIHWNF